MPQVSGSALKILVFKVDRLHVGLLKHVLASVFRAAIFATAGSIADVDAALRAERCDLLISGLTAPDGEVIDQFPRWSAAGARRILVVSSRSQPALLQEIARLPEIGMLGGGMESCGDLITAVSTAIAGECYWTPSLRISVRSFCTSPSSIVRQISPSERLVLGALGGRDPAAVANAVAMPMNTVASACRDLKRKLGLETTEELIESAARHGFAIRSEFGYIRPGLKRLLAERQLRLHRRAA